MTYFSKESYYLPTKTSVLDQYTKLSPQYKVFAKETEIPGRAPLNTRQPPEGLAGHLDRHPVRDHRHLVGGLGPRTRNPRCPESRRSAAAADLHPPRPLGPRKGPAGLAGTSARLAGSIISRAN